MARSKWSEAARAGFLASLAEQGVARIACGAIGLSAASAYHLRARDAGFAAEWDAAVEAARAARGERFACAEAKAGRMRDYRQRHDGWTPRREQAFLRTLAQTGCIKDAAARARISTTSVYRRRRRFPGFAARVDRAIAKAAPTVEQAAYERAVEGWDEVTYRDGREATRRRRYSDPILRVLLDRSARVAEAVAGAAGKPDKRSLVAQAEAAALAAGGTFEPRATSEETDKAILKKLDAIARHDAREAAEAGAADWLRWKAGWARLGGAVRALPGRSGPGLRLLG